MAYKAAPQVSVETITPDIAREYLSRNQNNRPIRGRWVRCLAGMIEAGEFYGTHQGIAFDTNGKLLDGQHRLHAIVLAGIPVVMQVTRNLPPEAREVIDTHATRTVVDAMRWRGVPVTPKHVSIGRILLGGPEAPSCKSTESRAKLISFVELHLEAISFVLGHFPHKKTVHGIQASQYAAPVARAWYTQEESRLSRFLKCFVTGEMRGPEDKNAVLLRDHAIMSVSVVGRGATRLRSDGYWRAENALSAFLDGRILSLLRPISEEQFPIPGERKG